MIVYLITNLINGKKYVGQTIQPLKSRWACHKSSGRGCPALKSAIKKYGEENFKVEEVDQAISREELDVKEKKWIAELNTFTPNGYNLTSGGEHPIFSEEARIKMSESMKNRKPWNKGLSGDPRVVKSTTIARKAMLEKFGQSGPNKGMKWSEESRAKASKSQTGRTHSEESKLKMSLGHLGIKRSTEFAAKMSSVKSHLKIRVFCDQTQNEYESINSASRATGVHSGDISRILKGTLRQSRGYTFKKV